MTAKPRRKSERDRKPRNCLVCGGCGAVCSACGGGCTLRTDEHEESLSDCPLCSGVGVAPKMTPWRGRWKPVAINGEPVPAATKRKARGLVVVVRDADGMEREVTADAAVAK